MYLCQGSTKTLDQINVFVSTEILLLSINETASAVVLILFVAHVNATIDLQISTIQLEISPNRLNCRYLQLNWRYLHPSIRLCNDSSEWINQKLYIKILYY